MTRTLMVTYDLISPGQKYTAIRRYVEAQRDWAKPLESMWLIRSSKTPMQVYGEVCQLVDGNDKILVADVTHSSMAWSPTIPDDVSAWIKKNVG